MKKRMLSVALATVLCLLSVFVNPVNTVVALETQSTSTESILPYDKMFLGVGDMYEIDPLIIPTNTQRSFSPLPRGVGFLTIIRLFSEIFPNPL